MTITALPTPPTRSDPTNFASRADAFLAALPTFQTEANALAVAMNLNATTDTSATSVTIGTGAKTFTVSSGKSFQPGMYLVIADTAAPSTNSMWGQVTSYSTTSLVMNIMSVLGSGTKTAWTISQSAPNAEFAYATNNATDKPTPVDADLIPIIDSAASNVLKKLTWANLKATIKTYLSGVAFPIGATTPSTVAATTISATKATGGDVNTWSAGSSKTGYLYTDAAAIGLFSGPGATNEGFYLNSTAHTISTYINGAVAETLDANGNRGLGVTPLSSGNTQKYIELTNSGGILSQGVASNSFTNTKIISGTATYVTSNYASFYSQNTGVHYWYTAPSGTAGNAITFTQSLAVGLGTTLALEGATSAAGTGIAFPATQVASSNANTLDDYEEGTWTPTISGDSGSGATYTAQTGQYTKVGNMVTVWGTVILSGKGTLAGSAFIDSLPFTCAASFPGDCGGPVGYYANLATTWASFSVSPHFSAVKLFIWGQKTAGSTATQMAIADLGATSRFEFSATYRV